MRLFVSGVWSNIENLDVNFFYNKGHDNVGISRNNEYISKGITYLQCDAANYSQVKNVLNYYGIFYVVLHTEALISFDNYNLDLFNIDSIVSRNLLIDCKVNKYEGVFFITVKNEMEFLN